MKKHISKTVSTCYYHLRKLYHLHRLVSQSVMKQLVTSFVLQRIDYCNSLLVNLPASTTASAACAKRYSPSHIWSWSTGSYYTCNEKKFHWLHIQYRIQSKISVFMHQCFHRRCPQYIFESASGPVGYGTTSFRDDKSGRRPSTTDQSRQTSILNRWPFCLEQFASISYINRWSWTVSETIEYLLF